MDLSDLLHGLQRAPWNGVARPILLRSKYEPGHGYKKTVASVLAEDDPKKTALLADGIAEHNVAGEKLVQLVKLSPAEKRIVDAWIRGKRAHANDLTDAYPGCAPESSLIPMHSSAPTSAGYAELEDGVAAIFTAVRSYITSEVVPSSSLKASAAAGFERLVGYKRRYIQTYDVIWLPEKGDFAVFCVDLPGDVPKADFANLGSAFLDSQLRKALGRPLQFANFWHAVDGLYKGSSGKLVDYGFSAGGQSVNHHKARRKGTVCLRSALYDAAGAAAMIKAGQSLELFKVAIEWAFRHADGTVTAPEVLIPGKAQDLNKPMPLVNHCVVRDCMTSSDISFVVSKVAPLVTHWV